MFDVGASFSVQRPVLRRCSWLVFGDWQSARIPNTEIELRTEP